MKHNACRTYFNIIGNFDPDIITEILNLKPCNAFRIGDMRPNGSKYTFSKWSFGCCDVYNEYVDNQMMATLSPLFGKIDLLNEIRQQFDVSFSLQIVPTVYAENTPPCLSPSMEVIDFCHMTRTEIDIDLYVMPNEAQ